VTPEVFRLGLIGAGRMGRTHLRALASSRRVAVTAVVEPVAAARAAVREAVRDSGPVYATIDELLEAGGVDGVLVAAPSDRHVEIVSRLAAAGAGLPSPQRRDLHRHGRPRAR